MSTIEIPLRETLEIDQLDVLPREERGEIQISLDATIRDVDEDTIAAIAGSTCQLEAVTVRIDP